MNSVADSATSSDVIASWMSTVRYASQGAYQQSLTAYANFVGVPEQTAVQSLLSLPEPIAHSVVLGFLASLRSAGLSDATCALRISALRSLAKHARRIGKTNLVLDIRMPQPKYKHANRSTDRHKLAAVLKILDNNPRPIDKRNSCMLRLAACLGLRSNELLGLDVSHVDLAASLLWICPKGKDVRRAVPLPIECANSLSRWLGVHADKKGALFYGMGSDNRRRRLSRRSLWGVVKKLGLGRTHGLRHLCVTRGLEISNGNAKAVAQLTGHASLASVDYYDSNSSINNRARGAGAAYVAAMLDADLSPPKQEGEK